MTKNINNIKNGYHLNSKYWQHYKKSLLFLPQHLFDVSINMILGVMHLCIKLVVKHI